MKRLILGLFAILLFSAFGHVPSANAWWWHHHSSPGPAGVGADKKSASSKTKADRHKQAKPEHLYNKPRSWGWWHHDSPGPVGAGAPEK
jgi:hypothetical protein